MTVETQQGKLPHSCSMNRLRTQVCLTPTGLELDRSFAKKWCHVFIIVIPTTREVSYHSMFSYVGLELGASSLSH